MELDPARPYCLMAAAALDYMAGGYIPAAERYRAALLLLPQHPAALLGLAEVLLSSAGQHVAMGATGAAALELTEAAQLATAAVTGVKTAAAVAGDGAAAATAGGAAVSAPSTCAAAAALALLTPSPGPAGGSTAAAAGGVTRVTAAGSNATAAAADGQVSAASGGQVQYSSNIVTAWKLLGDVLMQQHLLQPAAAAAVTADPVDADSAVAAALQGLAARQGLLAQARRAYAHALMLNPSAGEIWGDLAQCYSHQARLLLELQPLQPRQQQQGSSAADNAVAAARAAAVRMARGGLRLAPASSWLWGVLAGAAAAAGDAAAF